MRGEVEARAVLVGEDNPYGPSPDMALYPAPEGSAGWRLCVLILMLQRADYLRRFARVNLCDGLWSTREARARAAELAATGVPVVMLGAKVSAAFGRSAQEPFTRDGLFYRLPHPSGRCRVWNDPGAFGRARGLLAEFLS